MTRCPLCESLIFQQFTLTGAKETQCNWFFCRCGYMFHEQAYKPEEVFTEAYQKDMYQRKFIETRYDYLVRMYAPILEEQTYGRRMLDVGCCLDILVQKFRDRGWLATGIDLIPNPFITGDFETYDFENQRFDLVWLGDVIQCFKDPIAAIYKAYDLLTPHGLMVIITPNTDLLWHDKISAFGHWDMKTQKQFINERILREVFVKADASFKSRMQVLYSNPTVQSQRFATWNTMHMILQKRFIEDNPAYAKEMEDAKEYARQQQSDKLESKGEAQVDVESADKRD